MDEGRCSRAEGAGEWGRVAPEDRGGGRGGLRRRIEVIGRIT